MTDDCTCIYDSADGDRPQFFVQSWRKARKIHECCECHRAILPGERYEHYSGKWYDDIEVYKTCAECQDIRESLSCDGFTFLSLWENVEEQIFREAGLTIACVDKLATAAGKEMLQRRWMEFVSA